tara:strand:- start:1625 stop:1732 length:108 start_codon:yes stop_codon:yes gene_type:complete
MGRARENIMYETGDLTIAVFLLVFLAISIYEGWGE